MRQLDTVLAVLLASAILAPSTPSALAAPGDLVASFGTGGAFTAPFLTTFPGPEDSHTVAVDSLGRVYLSATQEPQLGGGPLRHVKVVRLTDAGVPDPTFGMGGTVTLPTSGDIRNAGIVVDDLDRPIILTNNGEGAAAWRIGLTRLTTAGEPDVTFDGDGVAESALPNTSWNPWPAGIALDDTGGILVVGTLIACSGGCTRLSGFVARFGTAGAIDGTYGTGGWTPISDGGTELSAIHALAGGGAVVAGFDDYQEWVVARLTAAGALDTDFDGDGLARSNLGRQTLDLVTAYGVTVDLQGRPVVLGQLTSGGGATMVLARWTTAGAPDATFGTGTPAAGVVLLPAGGRLYDAAAQSTDGKLVVVGNGAPPGGTRNQLVLARLGDSGALDPGFGPGGGTPGIATFIAGDHNVGADLVLTTAGVYVAGFRRLNDGMVVTDYPQVVHFVANEVSEPTTTTTATPTTTTTTTTATTPTTTTTASTIRTTTTTTTPATTTTTTTPSLAEDCGDCLDNNDNGLVDLDDPACCGAGAINARKLKLRVIPKNDLIHYVELQGLLDTPFPGKLADAVVLQLSQPSVGTLVCARFPLDKFFNRKASHRFDDRKRTVGSAEGFQRAELAKAKGNATNVRSRGTLVDLLEFPAVGAGRFVVSFADAAGPHCAAGTFTFKQARKKSLRAP